MEPADIPAWVTTSEIAAAVRRMPGLEGASVVDWTGARLTDGFGEGLGVWRLSGQAMVEGRPKPWSMILKGWSAPAADVPASAFTWPLRELELYRSGLLADLPGAIRAPACHGAVERPDGSAWLWLEEIAGARDGPWSLDQYAEVARHLGHLSALCLADCARFDEPWLSRGWLRQWVEAAAPAVADLARVADHPIVRRTYPPAVLDAFARLWDRREACLALLDGQPQGFAHLDAFRRNVFLRPSADGTDGIVLIDWGFAGSAAIGEEIAPLVAASLYFMDVPVGEARRLQEAVLAGYIDGLRAGGWRDDPTQVRQAFAIAATLRYGVGVQRIVLPRLLDEAYRPSIEQVVHHPFDAYLESVAGINAWLVELTVEIQPQG